ncbi:MAG TPA: phospho-N-acetylmuramoyl-pentapeptide-transferase [Chlamydiales bacterium]|nr:phospho-N-acetylmuramoyl-pentapeptide-transferase [Chlamydiales bacterium]
MLLLVCEWLRDFFHLKVPSAFLYFSTRMIFAAATSLLFTILLGPRFIKKLYELKIGQTIRIEECPLLAELHGKKKDTPTMGGVLILSSMIASLMLWMDLRSAFTLLLFLTTLWLGILGAVDDYLKLRYKNSKGLKAKKKFLVQVLFSSLIAFYLLCPSVTNMIAGKKMFRPPTAKEQILFTGSTNKGKGHSRSRPLAASGLSQEGGPKRLATVQLNTREYIEQFYVPFWKDPVWIFDGWLRILSFLLIVVVITGASNAVNLTDGLDGLASGCLLMVSLVLSIFAFLSNHIDLARYLNILYIEGSGEIAVYLFALAGAALGFLWYNGYPAQVFMGDTGSLAMGGVLGVSAVLLRREIILAIAGAIFVAEALSVILQVLSYRYRNKKRIFLIAPLHHHFEYKGWPETKVVLRFWIISLLFAIISIASLKFQ